MGFFVGILVWYSVLKIPNYIVWSSKIRNNTRLGLMIQSYLLTIYQTNQFSLGTEQKKISGAKECYHKTNDWSKFPKNIALSNTDRVLFMKILAWLKCSINIFICAWLPGDALQSLWLPAGPAVLSNMLTACSTHCSRLIGSQRWCLPNTKICMKWRSQDDIFQFPKKPEINCIRCCWV